MLQNERTVSCEQNCWHSEDKGGSSPRLWQGGCDKTHHDVYASPEIVDLTISSNCNLTCTYCCKEFSTAWLRDLINNGEYSYTAPSIELEQRNHVYPIDIKKFKTKQRQLKQDTNYQTLLNEIVYYSKTANELIVTGGDPFVDNDLFGIIEKVNMKTGSTIVFYTGLGVSFTRFKKYIKQIKQIKHANIQLRISAECTAGLLEFNRYGIVWEEFLEKINYLKEHDVNFVFHSTLSNLSVFGFVDFYKMFNDLQITTTFAYTPRMMAPYVLDPESKIKILEDITCLPTAVHRSIKTSITPTPDETQRLHIKEFLQEFARRRSDLSLSVFPDSFLKWIKI